MAEKYRVYNFYGYSLLPVDFQRNAYNIIDLINITFSFKSPRFIYKFYETVCQAWELTPIFLSLGDCPWSRYCIPAPVQEDVWAGTLKFHTL